MAKRFTDTNKYKKPFIRGLQGAYKLLWDFLYHDCDNAGIWIVDFDIAQLYLGNDMPVNKDDAIKFFNSDEERIIILENGKKWFIPSFIHFQYGELSSNNRAHTGVISTLKKYNIIDDTLNFIKPHISPLQGDKDKDMDKDMDKDKEKEDKKINFSFEQFWELYDKKVGEKSKIESKWNKLKDEERELSMKHIPLYKKAQPDKKYRKDPSTYINNKSWNDEIIGLTTPTQPKPNQPYF